MRQPIGGAISANTLYEFMTKQPDRSLLHSDEMDLIGMAQRMYRELNPDSEQPASREDASHPDEDADSSS